MKTSALFLLLPFVGWVPSVTLSVVQEPDRKDTSSQVVTPSETKGTTAPETKGTDTPRPAASSLPKSVTPKEGAKPARVQLSAGLAEIVRMVESGVETAVLETYIQNSNIPFYPSAAEIIYLHELGVPSQIVTALIRRGAEVRAQQAQAAKEMQNRIAQQQAAAAASQAQQASIPPVTYAPQPATYNYYVSSYPSYAYSYPVYTYPAYRYSYGSPFYSSFYSRPYIPLRHDSYYPRFQRYGPFPNYSFSAGLAFGHRSPVHSSYRASFGHHGHSGHHGHAVGRHR